MKMNQNGLTLIELMISLAILGILLSVVIPMFFGNRSDGERIGELVKLSHKGLWCKTWEGALKVSEGGGTGDAGIWEFTVESDSLALEIKGLLGKKVRVAYHEKAANLNVCSGDSHYRVQAVSEIK